MIPFSHNEYPYPSHRTSVYGRRGMVATSHPLATEAGMSVFRKGGNAVDAAVAAGAALGVVDPASTGPGGDLFAILSVKGQLYGLNASGPSPHLMSYEALTDRGFKSIPSFGWMPVTVSGGPAGWAVLTKRFGKLPLAESLEPAAELAEEHPVSRYTVYCLGGTNEKIKVFGEKNDPIFEPWFDMFAPGRKPISVGQVFHMPELAATLREIGRTDGESFYRGALAKQIASYSERTGGLLRYDDMAEYHPQWVDPLSINYRGYDIWEMPPNGQGITALIALNIMEGFKPVSHEDAFTVHRQIESMKLAFADSFHYVADPKHLTIDMKSLLSKEYAAKRRSLITEEKAITPPHGDPLRGGTIYLCTADGEGNMVSFVQSISGPHASGIVVPGTGILLQNRGTNFKMDPAHPNFVGPGKLPFHTIIPGFITKGGQPVGPFGIMRGHIQPQAHMQVVMNMIDFGMNPQAALDASRWFWQSGLTVNMESSWPESVNESLGARGHVIAPDDPGYGRGQVIVRLENGTLCGGTDHRSEGSVLAF